MVLRSQCTIYLDANLPFVYIFPFLVTINFASNLDLFMAAMLILEISFNFHLKTLQTCSYLSFLQRYKELYFVNSTLVLR